MPAKDLQPDSIGPHPTLSLTVNPSTNHITSTGFSGVYPVHPERSRRERSRGDAAGNMTDDALDTYTYNAENRLTATVGYTYTYDGLGRRVKKQGGLYDRLYFYGGSGEVLLENNLGGVAPNEYIFFPVLSGDEGNGQRVATYRRHRTCKQRATHP